jgi:hypothetical protein
MAASIPCPENMHGQFSVMHVFSSALTDEFPKSVSALRHFPFFIRVRMMVRIICASAMTDRARSILTSIRSNCSSDGIRLTTIRRFLPITEVTGFLA